MRAFPHSPVDRAQPAAQDPARGTRPDCGRGRRGRRGAGLWRPAGTGSRPAAVLLVPGYGGSPPSLDGLAARIRSAGRTATVVPLAGDGTGDLTVQARVLNGYVNSALAAGSGPVTVIGYSAGGVVTWLWYVDYGGASRTGKIITLGSPLHGARIAAVGTGF